MAKMKATIPSLVRTSITTTLICCCWKYTFVHLKSLLVTHPIEMGIYVQRTCTRMFNEALFIIVKTGTNPNMSINSRMYKYM